MYVPAWAGQAFVQSALGTTNNTHPATTAALATTSGSTLVVCAAIYSSTFAATPVTDSKSNTWTQIGTELVDGTMRLRMYYAKNITGGAAHTVSVDTAANTWIEVSVGELSGMDLTAPLDQTTGQVTGVGTSHASGNVTTTQNHEIYVGCGSTSANATLVDGNAPAWTTDQSQTQDATHQGLIMGHKVVTATSTEGYTWTSGAAQNAPSIIATIKEASAATTHMTLTGAGK